MLMCLRLSGNLTNPDSLQASLAELQSKSPESVDAIRLAHTVTQRWSRVYRKALSHLSSRRHR